MCCNEVRAHIAGGVHDDLTLLRGGIHTGVKAMEQQRIAVLGAEDLLSHAVQALAGLQGSALVAHRIAVQLTGVLAMGHPRTQQQLARIEVDDEEALLRGRARHVRHGDDVAGRVMSTATLKGFNKSCFVQNSAQATIHKQRFSRGVRGSLHHRSRWKRGRGGGRKEACEADKEQVGQRHTEGARS